MVRIRLLPVFEVCVPSVLPYGLIVQSVRSAESLKMSHSPISFIYTNLYTVYYRYLNLVIIMDAAYTLQHCHPTACFEQHVLYSLLHI